MHEYEELGAYSRIPEQPSAVYANPRDSVSEDLRYDEVNDNANGGQDLVAMER